MKKGFTLVELLGVIVLLGVIALIVIPISSNSIKNSKEKAYNQTIESLKDAAKLYSINNDLGYEYRYKSISLDELKQKGLIDNKDIINPIDNELMTGCIVYIWNLEYKQYIFEYSPECSIPEQPDYVDGSGANKPELYDKMIPVKYNTDTNKWQYVDTNTEWYNYNNKKWANAVVLNTGVSYSVGQDIEMTDIAMMYVWIPRYKYTIFNGNNGNVDPLEVSVVFESGISKTGTVTCTESALGSGSTSENCTTITNNVSTYTHPAFTFGDKELTGIWVGKFEVSTTDSICLGNTNATNCNKNTHKIVVKPNVDSLRYTNVSNLFTSVLNIKSNYSMNNIDSHMIKNMEWGALAFLTQSKYGRCANGVCEIVEKNNMWNNKFHTGCGSTSGATCQNEYHTTEGMKASTTGNIYGVYDMVGGASEYVMGNMVNGSGNFYSSSAGFGSAPDSKYYDKYTLDNSGIAQYTTSRGKLGDATKEALADDRDGGQIVWYSDAQDFVNTNYSWFIRGGAIYDTSTFYFYAYDGNYDEVISTRSVIVSK